MTWEPAEGDRIRCTRHDPTGQQLFGRKERCVQCDHDPGPLVTAEPETPEAPPGGCLSSVEHERKLTDLALFIEQKSRALCKGKGRINYATAFKGLELAIKAYNAASVYTQTRERRAHVAKLERRRRAMHAHRGRGGSN